MAGGAISLQDVARPLIINNTIANNDSTATSQLAFTAGQADSTAQIAGIHSGLHSDPLRVLLPGGDPVSPTRSWSTISSGITAPGTTTTWQTEAPAGWSPIRPDPIGTSGLNSNAGTMSPVTASSNTPGANPNFVSGYFNTLSTATVLDEAGNNISVRYTPLIPNSGNYHLNTGSTAVNTGTNAYLGTYLALALDFDGQARPAGPTRHPRR